MKKGQVINGAVIGVALLSAGVTWLGNYILSSPQTSASAISTINTEIAVLQKSDSTQDSTIKEVKDNVEYMRRVLEEMARRQGITVK